MRIKLDRDLRRVAGPGWNLRGSFSDGPESDRRAPEVEWNTNCLYYTPWTVMDRCSESWAHVSPVAVDGTPISREHHRGARSSV